MAEYALVDQDNVVIAVIVADSTFISSHGSSLLAQYGDASGTWVDSGATKVGPGWTYDPQTQEFAAPVVE